MSPKGRFEEMQQIQRETVYTILWVYDYATLSKWLKIKFNTSIPAASGTREARGANHVRGRPNDLVFPFCSNVYVFSLSAKEHKKAIV